MDTKSGTILATGRTSLVDGPNLPESEEQPAATKPLTEIQVHAVDLSLKSPQSLPPYSQSLHFKDTQKANRGKKRRCSGMEGEESGDNIIHTSVDPGVQKTSVIDPSLPDTDSIDTSGKETHSHSMVVLKDEIEEVCIGDSHSYWQGDSYPQVFLNEIKTEDKGSKVPSDDGDNAPEDSLGTIKEHHNAVMYEVGFLAKDATEEKTTVSERQMLDLTGIIKSNLLTGLSAELLQSMENCSSKNELSDSIQNSDEENNNEKGEADFPLVDGLGKRKEQRTNEPDTGKVENENLVIPKIEGEEEALNLSLPQRAVCNHTAKMEKYAEDGTGSQSTLVMEVDEIMQREEDEEEEHDNDSQALFDKEPAVVRVNVSDWGPKLSPPSVSLNNSPTSSTSEDLDGLLLIDDQGIPYTLTPDGKKVIQAAPSKSCKTSTHSLTKLKARWVEAKDSGTASSPDHDLPKKGLTEVLPCVSSKEITPQLSTSGSAPKIVPLLNNKHSQPAVISPSSLSSTLSNLTSQPVKIMANPTSNILLVPSSHLPSPQSAKPTTNASLLTLSLPISLNPNPPSAPLFLVLSPLTTSTPPSSLSSKVNVIDSIPSPLLSSNTQSSASASVPLSSGKTVTGSSSPSSGSLPVDALNSGTPSTSIVGNGTGPTPSPDSPSVSSGNIRQPKLDLTSKTALPKLSRVKKSKSPSKPDSTNVAANQTESSTSPVPIKSSPVNSPKSNTLQSTSTSSVCQTSKDSPPAPTSDTPADVFPSDQSHYERSGTPPPTAIFPTNHPKNFSLSSSCPRRILYCQYCPRAFYYLSDLERHSITHSQSKPYVCPLCNKAFKRSSHLERHKHIHTGQRNFICPICSKRFREAGELLRHQRVHTGEKPFQCPQCHMRFAERNTLRRHTKRKHHELNGHGDGEGMPGGQEESAEWYSCAVPDMDSDTEPDKD